MSSAAPELANPAGHRDPLRWSTYRRWILAAAGVSAAGGVIVFAFLMYSAPIVLTPPETRKLLLRSGSALVIFLVVAVPLLLRMRRRRFAASTAWIRQGRRPTAAEQRMALGAPGHAVRVSAAMWALGAVFFAVPSAPAEPAAALYIFATVMLGGVSTSAVWYLIVDRVMRPVSARALAGGAFGRQFGPTIQHRLMMAWTLGTGVPLLGIAVLAVGYLSGVEFEVQRTFGAILILVCVALLVGLFAILVAVRSVSERIGALREALVRVQAGEFGARVVVDDTSEIGRLQTGFNTMAAGLAERERIRDVFGTYVDRDVAEHILRSGATLAGEELEVTMMFVDVRGFTSLAEHLQPAEVVRTLNRLFERIVPVVHLHGGHVDKYAGDGLFAVFGAARRHPDHADRALAAAVQIADVVEEEFAGALSVGIGLNSGPVVAGNVGGAGRLEYSVIGDAVNVAARVEAATRLTGDAVLLSERTLAMLTAPHCQFAERPAMLLKGKAVPVQLYAPR